MKHLPNPSQLLHLDFDIPALMARRPPVWRYPHKQAIYDRIRKEGHEPQGTLRFTRWALAPLSGDVADCRGSLEMRRGFYRYEEDGAGVWHVNFADPRLFAAYGSALMAQDEWQAMEHPVLGAVRESLLYDELPALTRQDGVSTPVLLMNVPRQCEIDLGGASPCPRSAWSSLLSALGLLKAPARPLYGNAFQDASLDEVMAITQVIHPPASTNLIAIAAPTGRGLYTPKQIRDVLETAYAGFRAAVLESGQAGVGPADVVIHTGWWGCGAFGGNRVLMALLQIIAARLAAVGRLVFHIGNDPSLAPPEQVRQMIERFLPDNLTNIEHVIDHLDSLGCAWGASDGN